jgi:WbqC-like protein family
MIVAIMQPYFFPYIGYWQLIHAVDRFILLDDVQYIRHGWINRNRILKPAGGWQYIVVPLQKHNMADLIKNIQVDKEKNWKELIIRQLAHYKKKAKYFNETNELVREALSSAVQNNIASVNYTIIKILCASLGITTELIISSEHNFDYEDIHDAGEWALRISKQIGASEYINPIGGAELFNQEKFTSSNIKLSFFISQEITYSQKVIFEPSLSIIDVLMCNGIAGTRLFLDKYTIKKSGT